MHRLDGAFARVDRAGEHIAELKTVIESFRRGDHEARVSVVLDPSDRKEGESEAEWPILDRLRVAILVGEACYNLRTALDYMVYELAILDSRKMHRQTQFLIEDCPKVFKKK